jgi:opacity protein-like surface antigen
MNRKPLRLRLVLAAALAAPAFGAAHAQSLNGLYFGVGGGWVHYDIGYTTQVVDAYDYFLSPYVVQYADFGRNNLGGFKAWAGYQFVPWLAAEVSYVNLGSPTANYSVRATTGPSTNPNVRNATYKLQGINLSAVGTVPINEMFALHANVGAFYSEYKYSETGTNGNGDSHSFNAPNLWQWNLSYGAGASYNFNRQWAIRFDWDRFQDIGNDFALNETGNGKFENIDLFSFSLVYRF